MKHRKGIAALVAAAALGLGACGSDDDPEAAEAGIAEAVEAVAVSGDPAACTEFQTQRFVEQVVGEGMTGEEAVKACERSADRGVADAVEVGDIEVDGASATATASVTGSTFDGQTLNLALVEEDGRWKLDEFTSFAEFDRDRMVASYSKELARYVPPKLAACVEDRLAGLSDDELEGYLLTPEEADIELVFGECEKAAG